MQHACRFNLERHLTTGGIFETPKNTLAVNNLCAHISIYLKTQPRSFKWAWLLLIPALFVQQDRRTNQPTNHRAGWNREVSSGATPTP